MGHNVPSPTHRDPSGDADGDLDGPDRDAIAVVEVGGGDVVAVDGDGLDGRQLAEAGPGREARDKADDGWEVGAGQAQVAAGDAAEEEPAVAEAPVTPRAGTLPPATGTER